MTASFAVATPVSFSTTRHFSLSSSSSFSATWRCRSTRSLFSFESVSIAALCFLFLSSCSCRSLRFFVRSSISAWMRDFTHLSPSTLRMAERRPSVSFLPPTSYTARWPLTRSRFSTVMQTLAVSYMKRRASAPGSIDIGVWSSPGSFGPRVVLSGVVWSACVLSGWFGPRVRSIP